MAFAVAGPSRAVNAWLVLLLCAKVEQLSLTFACSVAHNAAMPPPPPMLARYVEFTLAHRRAVVVALLAVTIFWATRLPALRVEIDPDANLPQDHPYIEALQTLEQRFGEKNLIVIGLFPKKGDALTPEFLGKVHSITRRVGETPGIIRSTYLSIASPLVKAIEGADEALLVRPVLDGSPETVADAAEVRRRLFANPFWSGTIVAADASAAAIIANFRLTPELPGYPDIQEHLDKLIAQENDGTFTVAYGGPVAITTGLAHVTERTVTLLPFAMLVIAIIHYEAFRTLQGMFLPLFAALLAVVWSLGFMGFLRVPLDPFNTTTPILILAVAAGHAVQILKRYYEEYDRSRDQVDAVRVALLRVGPVMVTAGTIAALSFFSLTVFATATMRNFGLLTGFGILSALVLELTLIPAIRAMLPAPRETEMAREAAGGRFLDGILGRLAAFLVARPATVVGATLLIAAIGTVGAMQLKVDTSFKRQFGSKHPLRVADQRLNATLAGTNTLIFLIEGSADGVLHEPSALRAIADLQRFVEGDAAVGKTLSIVDYLKEMHRALHGGAAEHAVVPDSADAVSQYLFLYSMAGGPEDLNSQIDPEHRSAAVRVFLRNDSTEYGEALIARVRDHVARNFPSDLAVRYSGTLASDAALAEVMVHGKILNMMQIAAIIIIVAGLVMRSLVAGLLIAAPLAMAVLTNLGMMGFVGIPLDIMTAPIAAMAVGIGADYAIYFLFRYREELAVNASREVALDRTLRTSGKAIVYVSSAIAGGYLVLCASGFVFHIELGTMVALAMVVSSLAAITLLPALLLIIEPSFLSQRATRHDPIRLRSVG